MLFDDLVKNNYMEFLLTYKPSQDHWQVISAINSSEGFNDSPSVVQFKSAFRRLCNCLARDDTNILQIFNSKKSLTCFQTIDDVISFYNFGDEDEIITCI